MDPLVGTIGLASIAGDVGKGIEFGEWLNGEGFHVWEHAFLLLPGNKILEAEPGGAKIVDGVHYDQVYWCTNIRKLLHPTITDSLIETTAEHLKGVPYSFLDYAALATHRLHVPGPWLKDYIESEKHMICSQLVDYAYELLGTQIFTDNRWTGFVTPASLYNQELELAK